MSIPTIPQPFPTQRKNTPNLIGQTFGQLTVLAFAKRIGHRWFWTCQCTCGNLTVKRADGLRPLASCGCYKIFCLQNRPTHHCTGTPEHRIWVGMRSRCNPQKASRYPNYAGRGIQVCKRWDKFENFLHDMGKRPSPKHTIERVNNNGHYEPSNCVWATYTQQLRNRRNTRVITVKGIAASLAEQCERWGVPYTRAYDQLRRGIPIEEVFG